MIEALALAGLLIALFGRETLHYRESRAVAQERAQERSEWSTERSELLNRIKPDTAQGPREIEPPPMDDDKYWDKVEGPFEEQPFGEQTDQPWAETVS